MNDEAANPVRATVVLPCWNEEQSVLPLVESFRQAFPDKTMASIQLLFIDDGSTDQTWANIQSMVNASGELPIAGVHLKSHLGKTSAQAIGLRWAVAHGGGTVVFMDSDGQHDPHALLDPLRRCNASGRTQVASRPGYRRTLISALGTAGLRLLAGLTGVPFRPDLAEFVVISKQTANRLATDPNLGTSPLLPLVEATSDGFETFRTSVLDRLDGTVNSRWSNENLWQKAVLHLLTNPWRLLLRLSIVLTAAILALGTYGLIVGLSSMASGTFLGVGSILVTVVFAFAMLAMLQIATLAFIVLLLKRFETLSLMRHMSEQERHKTLD